MPWLRISPKVWAALLVTMTILIWTSRGKSIGMTYKSIVHRKILHSRWTNFVSQSRLFCLRFATITEASVANPLCVLKARITYENMLVHGRNEQWYQNTKHIICSDKCTELKSIMVGNWGVKNIYLPRGIDALHRDFIDSLGKVVSQIFKGN